MFFVCDFQRNRQTPLGDATIGIQEAEPICRTLGVHRIKGMRVDAIQPVAGVWRSLDDTATLENIGNGCVPDTESARDGSGAFAVQVCVGDFGLLFISEKSQRHSSLP